MTHLVLLLHSGDYYEASQRRDAGLQTDTGTTATRCRLSSGCRDRGQRDRRPGSLLAEPYTARGPSGSNSSEVSGREPMSRRASVATCGRKQRLTSWFGSSLPTSSLRSPVRQGRASSSLTRSRSVDGGCCVRPLRPSATRSPSRLRGQPSPQQFSPTRQGTQGRPRQGHPLGLAIGPRWEWLHRAREVRQIGRRLDSSMRGALDRPRGCGTCSRGSASCTTTAFLPASRSPEQAAATL